MSERRVGTRTMKRSVRRCVFVLLAAVVAGATVLGAPSPVRAQPPSRVALVVHFGDRTVTRCVSFEESQISGYDVLERSGVEVTASFGPMGAAICAIEGVGCPAERCLLCEAPRYWSYWRLVEGAWTYLQRGPSLAEVTDGDVQGWAWGEGGPPPRVAFGDVCGPHTSTASPTSDATRAPTDATEPTATRDPARTTASPSSLPTATQTVATAETVAQPASPSSTPTGGSAAEPSWTSYALFGGLASGLLAAALWFGRRRS